MGNGTTCSESEGLITYDDHTRVMSPRPFCYFIMKIVAGNEKRVTRVRMWPIHSNIELVAKPYKFIGAFSEGFRMLALVADCCNFCWVPAGFG